MNDFYELSIKINKNFISTNFYFVNKNLETKIKTS